MTIIIVSLLVIAIWYAIFITLWIKGNKNKNKGLFFAGAIGTLWLIGLVIAIVITSGWSYENVSSEKLELEKARLELEKQKLEFEKTKQELNK